MRVREGGDATERNGGGPGGLLVGSENRHVIDGDAYGRAPLSSTAR